MKLKWDTNAYDAVEKIVLDTYGPLNASIVVQLQMKYDYEDNWEECTELLLNDGESWDNPEWIWENDWWEGQQDVDLIAAAPIYAVKLEEKWRMIDNADS